MDIPYERWLAHPLIGRVVAVLLGLLVILVTIRILRGSIGRYVTDNDTRYRARKGVSFLGYLLAAGLTITIFSDRLATAGVVLGVAGAGIAFALQEVIASVAGWVAVSFGGFYRTGDRVQLGGIRGDVIDIGILRTTLMELGQWVDADIYNGRIVRIANSFVFKEPVFNYSADFPFLWDELKVPIRYGSDWKFAREMLVAVANQVVGDYATQSTEAWRKVARKYLIEEARVAPMVTLKADENWIEFTLRYVVDYRKRRTTKDELFALILERVDASDGRIRIASASFEVTSLPEVHWKPAPPSNRGDDDNR